MDRGLSNLHNAILTQGRRCVCVKKKTKIGWNSLNPSAILRWTPYEFPLSSTNCSSCHFSALSPSTPIRRFHYTPSETLFTHSTIIVFLPLILSIHPLRFILQFHFLTSYYPPPIAHTPLYNLYSVELPKTATDNEIHRTISILIKTNTPH